MMTMKMMMMIMMIKPDYNNMPDLETEEEASERILKNALDKFKTNIEIKMNKFR